MISLSAVTTSKGNVACTPLLLHQRLFLTQFKTLVSLLRDHVIIYFMDEINTGSPNVINARGQSISRGVHNGFAFANFKPHEFSYLNITSLGTDYVLDGKECGFACVVTPSCYSYNLAAFYDISRTMLCELLPSDKYNNSDKFVSSQSFHHFSVVVSTAMTASLKCIFIILFLASYYLQGVGKHWIKLFLQQCVMTIQMIHDLRASKTHPHRKISFLKIFWKKTKQNKNKQQTNNKKKTAPSFFFLQK